MQDRGLDDVILDPGCDLEVGTPCRSAHGAALLSSSRSSCGEQYGVNGREAIVNSFSHSSGKPQRVDRISVFRLSHAKIDTFGARSSSIIEAFIVSSSHHFMSSSHV